MRFVAHDATADGDEVRVETLRGEEYLVAPVVLVKEGVLNGGFLDYEEIKRSAPGWNGEPLTAPPEEGTEAANLAPGNPSGHPIEGQTDDGKPAFASANQRPFIEDMHVGMVANVAADDEIRGLTGEAWLHLNRAKSVGDHAIEAARRINDGEPLDVSTGYFHDPIRTQGRHDGETYAVEQTNLMPDHLALLPNERGACSWADGCGAPRVNAELGIGEDDEGHSCSCGCGGSCDAAANSDAGTSGAASPRVITVNSMNYDIQTLAERTAFDAETLQEWTEANLESLAETVEANDDGGSDGGDGSGDGSNDGGSADGTTDGSDGGDGSDGDDDDTAANTEEIEALRERLETLEQERDEARRSGLVERVAANTGFDRDTLDDMDTDSLETLAEDLPEDGGAASGGAGPAGNRVNYAGQAAGSPTSNAEEDAEDYTANVGALAQLDAEGN